MSQHSEAYSLIQQDSEKEDSEYAYQKQVGGSTWANWQKPPTPIPRVFLAGTTAIAVGLLISIILNCFLLLPRLIPLGDQPNNSRSPFAELQRTTPIQIYDSDEYVDANLTAASLAWEALSGDPGVVALEDDWAAHHGLPKALRFPWNESKGVYLLQGFHNLHCLRTVYRYAINAHRGDPQPIAFAHILHCLDQLRQDVICNADDTPRYAGFQDPPGTGSGQLRMCRNWTELEKWAREHTACFKHEDEKAEPLIDRFKFCPADVEQLPSGQIRTKGR